MPNAVWFISYELKEGASEPDYLAASEQVNNEILSKQKGFISWQLLKQGNTWVDLITWETMEDAKKGETAGQGNPLAKHYYSFMNFKTLSHQKYTLEKEY